MRYMHEIDQRFGNAQNSDLGTNLLKLGYEPIKTWVRIDLELCHHNIYSLVVLWLFSSLQSLLTRPFFKWVSLQFFQACPKLQSRRHFLRYQACGDELSRKNALFIYLFILCASLLTCVSSLGIASCSITSRCSGNKSALLLQTDG